MPEIPVGAAFLLAQVGAAAANRFAQRIAELGLTPPQAGLLRLLAGQPATNQRAMADRLGVAPSTLVALVDDLEERGWVERRRDGGDRRASMLHLTEAGRATMQHLGEAGREHEFDITAPLDEPERQQLIALLQKVASQQGLTPGVHPGYRAQR